ncbi:MAG: hypothetical protein JW955_06320 [Sedimentisphaerales bacterium]|nr:hypothetical protein [Sedimentisphaerales bacterium]
MKRFLLTILLVGLLVGQASADMVKVTDDLLKEFDTFTVTTGSGSNFAGPLTAYPSWPTMEGDYGWRGELDHSNDTVLIHASGDAGLSGSYDGFAMTFYNDDDDNWSVRLYVSTTTDGTLYGAWTTISGHPYNTPPAASAMVSLGSAFTMDSAGDIGFEMRAPYNDVFHISAVPLPGAILLGFLGLGVAGAKLRRFA